MFKIALEMETIPNARIATAIPMIAYSKMLRAVESLAASPPAVMNKIPAQRPITTASKPTNHATQFTNPRMVFTNVSVFVTAPCVPSIFASAFTPRDEFGACANAVVANDNANAQTITDEINLVKVIVVFKLIDDL